MTTAEMRGLWATVLLDVGPDGTPDMGAIAGQVAALAQAGVDGVYCNGTAGEFHLQTDAQMAEVARHTVAAARDAGLPVHVGAAHPLPQGALDRIRIAAALTPDAVQVTLPDWTPLDPGSAERFLRGCAEAAGDAALVLYHPPQARTPLTPQDLARLADRIAPLIGLKCGGGDAAWYRAMAPVADRIAVFVPGHTYATGIAGGAHGAYSNLACLDPAFAVRWARQAHADPAAAAATQARVAAFMEAAIAPMLAAGWPGFACDKAMVCAGGWTPLAPRLMWPYPAIPAAHIRAIAAARRQHLSEGP